MKDYRKLDLEDLDMDDYKVLICALNCAEAHQLEIEEYYYDELCSKLQSNFDVLFYNSQFESKESL